MDEKLNKILASFNEALKEESFQTKENDSLEERKNIAYDNLDICSLININKNTTIK